MDNPVPPFRRYSFPVVRNGKPDRLIVVVYTNDKIEADIENPKIQRFLAEYARQELDWALSKARAAGDIIEEVAAAPEVTAYA